MGIIQVVIDGTWITKSRDVLSEKMGHHVVIDYRKLERLLFIKAACLLPRGEEYSPARTAYFGSVPVNYDKQDEPLVQKQLAFLGTLKNCCKFLVKTFGIDFRGHRIPKEERHGFAPHEKCVDSAIVCHMVEGAITGAYDVAVLVAGDKDFLPALETARRYGRKVVLASVHGNCSGDYIRQAELDAPVIWLDEMIAEFERPVVAAPAPAAAMAPMPDTLPRQLADALEAAPENAGKVVGVVSKVVEPCGYGFIVDRSNRSFFFHVSDVAGVAWDSVKCGLTVVFAVDTEPSVGRAGKGVLVRPAFAV